MQIKRYSDGTIKLHFFDHDRYEVTEDNGVDVWINKVDGEILTGKSERDKVLDKFKEIIQLHDEDDLLYEFLVIYKSLREQP
jgi:hypothetical protein